MNNRRILLFGSSGTAGFAVLSELLDQGFDVTTFGRSEMADLGQRQILGDIASLPHNLFNDVDVVISCLASRNGLPADAWAIDYKANSRILAQAKQKGVSQFVLLSAICVQKPKLAFQHAKLAFEAELVASGLCYSIVRPTAFFKSLSGQIERMRAGKAFLMFGDGKATSCLPISDQDLARYIVGSLSDESRKNRILPIGGPGAPITPLDQGLEIARLLGVEPKFRKMPIGAFKGIVGGLGGLSKLFPGLRPKAELARIGQYYGTESMLVWDDAAGRYSAQKTPTFGTQTLFEHYADLVERGLGVDLNAHKMF